MTAPIELEPIEMNGLRPAGRQDFGALAEELLRNPAGSRERPYLACNLISTLDGRATVSDSTEQLGFHTDARALMRLRTFADVVVIGAGTMRVERYDRIVPVPRLRAYRVQIGLPEDPLTVIVTDSMDLPWDAGMFSDGHGEVLLATSSSLSPPPTATAVRTLRFPGGVDLTGLLETLAVERGARAVLCEGGPTILNGMVEAGLADDLFLTLNPVLTGDGERGLLRGPLRSPVPARLEWVLEADGELFTRWRLGRHAAMD